MGFIIKLINRVAFAGKCISDDDTVFFDVFIYNSSTFLRLAY
jgi:hypothetical protein